MRISIKALVIILGILLVTLILTEFGVAYLFSHVIRGLPAFVEMALNTIVLVTVAGIVLYIYIFQVLVREIAMREKAQENAREASGRERKALASATLAAAQYEKKLAAAVAQAVAEQEAIWTAAAARDKVGYEKALAAAEALTVKEREKLATVEARAADNHKKSVDNLRDRDQRITAAEEKLDAAYQRTAEVEQELRVLKVSFEQKVKESADELADQKVKVRTKKLEEARDSFAAALEAKGRELRDEMAKVARMEMLMSERDIRVIEAKREVNRLCRELGRPEPYLGGAGG